MPATVPGTRSAAPGMACRSARVVTNTRIAGGCHVLELEPEAPFPSVRAGQFAMLSLDQPGFPTLPRPFSVLRWWPGSAQRPERLQFLVMPVGRGSGMLCSLAVGDSCQVVAPLGRAFDEGLPDGPITCVAGGYGIAPFVFLAEAWQAAGDARLARLSVVFGARTAERLSLVERLVASGCRVVCCTEDGSRGLRGRVDRALEQEFRERRPALVLTCGPEAMMEAVGHQSRAAGVPCRASLETVMGCGYAVCNGCAVAVSDAQDGQGYTYELACREGTVFDEARLQWTLL